MESGSSRGLCKLLAGLSIAAGAVGMPMSFLYLASASMADITAGTSGFVAGAILIGAGLISLSVLAATEPRPAEPGVRPPEDTRPSAERPEQRITTRDFGNR